MKRYISLLVLLILAGWQSTALAHSNGAGTFDCFRCHSAAGQDEAEVQVTGLPKAFEPGKTYRMRITVKSALESMSDRQGGFAVQASAGEMRVVDQVNTQLIGGVATHTLPGAAGRSWEISWKAPKDRKPVDLTVMAVAANGDFSPFGDPVAAQVFTVTPAAAAKPKAK